MKIRVQQLHQDAVVPKYAHDGDACFDLCSIEEDCVIYTATLRTGLAFEIPADHVMLIFSRSGHGFNDDIRLANCVGVIDSGYRGEVMVKLTSDGSTNLPVNVGDRIAQAIVLPFPAVEFEVAEDLSSTDRGAGGFGSTGK